MGVSNWRPYVVGVAAVAGAWATQAIVGPYFGPIFVFVPLVAATLLTALLGGLRPTLLAMALSYVIAIYGYIAPGKLFIYELEGSQEQDSWVALGVYFLLSLTSGLLTELLYRQRRTLIATHQRLETTLASIGDAVIAADERGRITFVNRAAEQLTGWKRTEALGNPLEAVFVIHDEGTLRFLTKSFNAANASAPSTDRSQADILLVTRDGSHIPIEHVTTTIRGDDGTKAGVVLVFRDISERQAAQAAQARLAAVIEYSDDAIFTMSLPGVITSWNVGAEQLYGYAAREAIGREVAMLVPEDGPDEFAEVIERLCRGERIEHFETQRRRKDGSSVDVSVRVSPIYDPGGNIKAASVVARDITKSKHAVQSLALSESRYRAMFELAGIGMAQADPITGRYLRVNPKLCEIVGYSEAELLKMRFSDVTHPDDRAGDLAEIRRALFDRDHGWRMEKRYVRQDGQVIWVTLTGTIVFDDHGRPLHTVAHVQDITERKNTELERERLLERERAARGDAERANLMKDEFVSTVSHELRTPLNAILGWAELLRRQPTREDLETGLEVIERNTKAQAQIVEDLLDMSRILSGKIRLDMQPVSLALVVNSALNSIRPSAEARGITLVKQIDAASAQVNADPHRLQQVVWNLLSNAIKFTPSGGSVWVSAATRSGQCEIEVRDTGRGIGADFLPFVFDRFRQADGSTTRRYGGLGLGLSIVKQLVELHGGTVRVESPGDGQGATFHVTLPGLPAEPSEPRPPAKEDNGAIPTRNLAGLKVLVVEDEKDARDLLERILRGFDADVVTAEGASQALQLLTADAPDLILSDIGMPDQDGYEFIRRVRALEGEHARRVPAIAVTAFARSEDKRLALAAGYQSHVSKPVDAAELVAVAASLVSQRYQIVE